MPKIIIVKRLESGFFYSDRALSWMRTGLVRLSSNS